MSAGADIVHFDVMDNHYVPNLTIGPLVCDALRKYGVTAPIDVHLMVKPVDRLVEDFAGGRRQLDQLSPRGVGARAPHDCADPGRRLQTGPGAQPGDPAVMARSHAGRSRPGAGDVRQPGLSAGRRSFPPVSTSCGLFASASPPVVATCGWKWTGVSSRRTSVRWRQPGRIPSLPVRRFLAATITRPRFRACGKSWRPRRLPPRPLP